VLANADMIIGQNIKKFDLKKLQARLIYHKLPPLPKLSIVDTLTEARKSKFTSNRLDYLGKHLLGEGKMEVHYSLWLDVMKGSKSALKKMISYCNTDVVRNEDLYLRLRPYMLTHPHLSVMRNGSKEACNKCGGECKKDGVRTTVSGGKQQIYKCSNCSGYHSVPFKQTK
jgi:hypothetical protein